MTGRCNDVSEYIEAGLKFLPRSIGVIVFSIQALNLRSLLWISVLLALLLGPCYAECSFSVRNAVVDPNFGYGDFNYSSQIGLSGNSCFGGNIAVSKFSVTLNIYDGQRLLRSDSSQERLLSDEERGSLIIKPFSFGPYSFQRDFGISKTNNASYEFIVKMGRSEIARSIRYMGPIVESPSLSGQPIYNSRPYFFQDLGLSASVKDMKGLSPSCHFEFKGLTADGHEASWSSDVPCGSSGDIYSIRAPQDLTSYREGGNFTFTISYNNQRLDPIIFGPYNFTVLPYSPKVKVSPVARVDYTNFSIKAYVTDAGGAVLGGKPNIASLIITHPNKAQVSYNISNYYSEGGYLVFEWDRNTAPFNQTDVILSEKRPFQARVDYWNDNWKYGARADNFSFKVVEEFPTLSLTYDPGVYLEPGKAKSADVKATVTYSKGMGDLLFHLGGPGLNQSVTKKGKPAGLNSYLYEWSIPFDQRQAGGNYTLTLEYIHPSLEGGSYNFDDKRNISVIPISIDFQKPSVDPSAGSWNQNYTYSVLVASSVEAEVTLQVYNPCSSEWEDIGDTRDISPGISDLNWTIVPFQYPCPELNATDTASQEKYRFKARFQGEDYPSKRTYFGPTVINEEPSLLDLEYSPTVYISKGSQVEQTIKAMVEYPLGSGQMRLGLSGPGMSLNKTVQGTAIGENKYQYEWKVLFSDSHIYNNYTLSLIFSHPSLSGGSFAFSNRSIQVLPIYIAFENASVSPTMGLWNATYSYFALLNSSVAADITLQTYNPCSQEWVDRDTKKISAGRSQVSWQLSPFPYGCSGVEWDSASYRFIAGFGQVKNQSMAYHGPFIQSDPELISLDYDPVLYVSDEAEAYQVVTAIVRYIPGMGNLRLGINGPGMGYYNDAKGADLGGHRYLYKWRIPFGKDQAGNHTISLIYLHPSLSGGSYAFPDQFMRVEHETGIGSEPKLIGFNYTPVLFVSQNKGADQAINAQVFSPEGKGVLRMTLAGKGKNINETKEGKDLGGNIYQYDYSEPFDASNANSSYRISLDYLLDGQSYVFGDHIMTVAMIGSEAQPVWEPALNLRYDPVLDIPSVPGGEAVQYINATVIYPNSDGRLKLSLMGPNMRYENEQEAVKSSGNRSVYNWQIPFNRTHAGNSYRISLAYSQTDLSGGAYRFTDYYMRVRQEGGINNTQNMPESHIAVIGNVTPSRGVLQGWQENDNLYSFTYTVQLRNLSAGESPMVELLIKAPGHSWKLAGEKQQYDPAQGHLAWTIKPFYDAEFLGMAEYRFLVDGVPSRVFVGPQIVAIYKDLSYEQSSGANKFDYSGNINASIDLTVDMLGSEDNIYWKNIGIIQNYTAGSGEVPMIWKNQNALRYYEFDIRTAGGKVIS